jgi:serine/threonine-protein kinase HipA
MQGLWRRIVFNVLISNTDDHLRNHGFLWSGREGWILSPAYDLNPTPTDVRPRILTTNISLDEATCDLDLALASAEFFGISLKEAQAIAKDVGTVVSRWRDVATAAGAQQAEIRRMTSAFDHNDLARAVAL